VRNPRYDADGLVFERSALAASACRW